MKIRTMVCPYHLCNRELMIVKELGHTWLRPHWLPRSLKQCPGSDWRVDGVAETEICLLNDRAKRLGMAPNP